MVQCTLKNINNGTADTKWPEHCLPSPGKHGWKPCSWLLDSTGPSLYLQEPQRSVPASPRPEVSTCAIHGRLAGGINTLYSTAAVSKAIQKRGRRFRPVYFVSARTSLPCRRLRSFFSRIQSRLFFTDLPLAFLNRVLSLVNFAWCTSSPSAHSVPRPFGNVPDAPTKRQRKNFLALVLFG